MRAMRCGAFLESAEHNYLQKVITLGELHSSSSYTHNNRYFIDCSRFVLCCSVLFSALSGSCFVDSNCVIWVWFFQQPTSALRTIDLSRSNNFSFSLLACFAVKSLTEFWKIPLKYPLKEYSIFEFGSDVAGCIIHFLYVSVALWQPPK